MSDDGRNKHENPDPPIPSRHSCLLEGVNLPAHLASSWLARLLGY
jgi:hypothetical protein